MSRRPSARFWWVCRRPQPHRRHDPHWFAPGWIRLARLGLQHLRLPPSLTAYVYCARRGAYLVRTQVSHAAPGDYDEVFASCPPHHPLFAAGFANEIGSGGRPFMTTTSMPRFGSRSDKLIVSGFNFLGRSRQAASLPLLRRWSASEQPRCMDRLSHRRAARWPPQSARATAPGCSPVSPAPSPPSSSPRSRCVWHPAAKRCGSSG